MGNLSLTFRQNTLLYWCFLWQASRWQPTESLIVGRGRNFPGFLHIFHYSCATNMEATQEILVSGNILWWSVATEARVTNGHVINTNEIYIDDLPAKPQHHAGLTLYCLLHPPYGVLTFTMLTYYMLKYPLACASAGTPTAHFSGYLNYYWWKNHALTCKMLKVK